MGGAYYYKKKMAMAMLPIIVVLIQLYSVEVDAWGIVIQGFKPKDLSCPGVGYEWLNPFSTNPNFIKAFYKVGSWDECAKYCEENAKCETWIYWWDKKARWAFQCRIYTLDHPKTIEIVTHLYNNTIMGLKGCRQQPDSCAELYTCQENKSQYGHDLDHFNTNNQNACAKKCCENTECIGFDWDTKSMDCWLSKMTWNDVPLNDHNYRWACQKKDLNNNECAVYEMDLNNRRDSEYHYNIPTWGACAQKCAIRADCKYWLYHDRNDVGHAQTCVTMSGYTGTEPRATTYYGSKSCQDCYKAEGRDYNGKVAITTGGFTCQKWNDAPNSNYIGKGENNYCRNPLPSTQTQPWCYTTDGTKRWQTCGVPKCADTA